MPQGILGHKVSSLVCSQAQHALSVCHNKLGDLQYTQGNLPAAREQYNDALAVRRGLCEASGNSTPQPAQQVHSWQLQKSCVSFLLRCCSLYAVQHSKSVPTVLIDPQVDLAASLVKVADINSALGNAAAAKQPTAEASNIATSLKAADLDSSVQHKLAGIKAYLDSAPKA